MSARRVVTLAIVALAPFAGVPSARAEKDIMGGGYLLQSFPMDDWGKTAGYGLGLDGTTIVRPSVDRPLALRTSAGFLYNFSRTADVPPANYSPQTNTLLDLETKNTSIFFGIGPADGVEEMKGKWTQDESGEVRIVVSGKGRSPLRLDILVVEPGILKVRR